MPAMSTRKDSCHAHHRLRSQRPHRPPTHGPGARGRTPGHGGDPAAGDLAASMLAMLDDDRYLRTTISVVTTINNPTLLQWIRKEALAAK